MAALQDSLKGNLENSSEGSLENSLEHSLNRFVANLFADIQVTNRFLFLLTQFIQHITVISPKRCFSNVIMRAFV